MLIEETSLIIDKSRTQIKLKNKSISLQEARIYNRIAPQENREILQCILSLLF